MQLFDLLNIIGYIAHITRQQKTGVRKTYRSKVVAIDNDGELVGAVTESKKKSKDDNMSVSMLTVDEVSLF